MASDPVIELVELLREAKAVPRLVPERISRSPLYDPAYRAILLVLTLKLCGKRDGEVFSLNHQKLRLFQFVALHDALLDPMREWISARKAGSLVPLEQWARFPSGYAADTVFDDVVTYLEATEQVKRESTRIVYNSEETGGRLARAIAEVEEHNLFAAERAVLQQLASTSIPLNLLKL